VTDKKYKACISILSSRTKCLPLCVKSLWEKWNYKYNYPVYIYYYDDIYDNEYYRKKFIEFTKSDVRFISIPYETPEHIPEEELFYNRSDLWYSRTQFPIQRKGFLHMCHFYNNPYGHPNTEFEKYDYFLCLDDETAFVEEIPYDFFQVMEEEEAKAAAIKIYDPKLRPPHQGNLDTRVGMFEFAMNYLEKYQIEPKADFIAKLFTEEDPEKYFHDNLFMACSWAFDTKMFRSPEWEQWSHEVNTSGGIYKYRWSDCELIVLFLLIHHGRLPHDFKTADDGYYDLGALRHIQDYAPGVRDNTR